VSSFTGSGVDTSNDNSLQLAPVGEDGPDFNALKSGFQKCVTDTQPFADQCRLNYETRFAIWPGQSADGKKHSREGSKIDPTPWDGASDLRVYLVDNVINKKVAMQCMAVRKANLVAVPIEGNDIKRAKIVSNFMRWLIRTQIPGLDREEELLSNYLNEKGVAVTGQFWEKRQEKILKTVSITELVQEYPQIAQAVQALGGIDPIKDDLIALFEEIYGCTKKKAKKMLAELTATGKTTVATLGKERSYPVIRAFNLDNDLFVPSYATDIETCPAIYRVQYFSPEKLRSMVKTDGWNEVWVEKAIETCKGKLISLVQTEYNTPLNRSFIYTQQRFTDQIAVVYAYQRLSDEDGVPGLYLSIFHPDLPPSNDQAGDQPGYAKHELYGDSNGQFPFVLHRREYLSRKLMDSRGIPEPGKPWQDQIKAHKDSRIDAASIAVIPPLLYPIGRPPSRWGPGARIPERRPNEYHYADRPAIDPITDDSEDRLASSFKEYNGMLSQDGDPVLSPLENQFEVDKYMSGWSKAYNQVFKLYKKFGDEQKFFRVIGLNEADPMLFEKGGDDEEFDFYLSWDVQSMDFKQMGEKLAAVIQAVQTLDRDGTTNYSELLQVVLESVDPNIAQRILQPVSVGQEKVVNEVHSDLTQLSAGVNKNIKIGTPPQLAMQVVQQWMQGAPDVQQRLQTDEPFRKRIEAYMKQLQFQVQQQQNAVTGRLGAAMPGPTAAQPTGAPA
tara:strand:+ start:1170 stop:3347 length:2178 start_codon:yes stop_codon:yes gene_type:complete